MIGPFFIYERFLYNAIIANRRGAVEMTVSGLVFFYPS